MGPDDETDAAAPAPDEVFVVYAHEDADHRTRVLRFADVLRRECGVNAELDSYFEATRQRWNQWARLHITHAAFVIVVASPTCRLASEANFPSDRNRGIVHELGIIEELLQRDRATWERKILPVLLPGASPDDIPLFLHPYGTDHYRVDDLSPAGMEDLLRTILREPKHVRPPLLAHGDILAELDLRTADERRLPLTRGAPTGSYLRFGRPLVYRLGVDDLSGPLRQRSLDGLAEYVGAFFTVEVDAAPPGFRIAEVMLSVDVDGEGSAVSLSAGDRLMDLTPPSSADRPDQVPAPRGLVSLADERPGWLGRFLGTGRVPTRTEMPRRAEGLLHSRFSWTFEPSADIWRDGVTPRGAFAAHAVVELPPDREALSGTLSGTVRAERHGFSLTKGPTSRSVADVPFSATYARGRQRDADTERGVRFFVVTEVDAYERLGIDHAERTQRWLDQVVAEAVARTEVRDVVSQPRGASIVSTFPPGTDEGTALSRFYSGLLDAIADIADRSLVDQPLRLRVGMASGQSSRGTTGWSGRAAECAATLVGVDVVRETLAGSPDAVVVLAVSDALYHDVVRDLRRPPRAAGFRRVDLGGRVHGTDTAWVHVASA